MNKNYESQCLKCTNITSHYSGVCRPCRTKKCEKCLKPTTSKYAYCSLCLGGNGYSHMVRVREKMRKIA